MGPPDLCHILKFNPKLTGKEYGSYHFVSGVDTSSSATIAAYLNSLSYSLVLLFDIFKNLNIQGNYWRETQPMEN